MAQFKNVSGADRHLSLPEWLGPRLVEADATVEIPDEVASQYDFDQPGVWESVETKKSTTKDGK